MDSLTKIKAILIILAIFSFSLIMLSIIQIISANIDITDNCKLKTDKTPMKTFSPPPKDELDAKDMLESFLQEDVEYTHIDIEPCGFAYYFNNTISGMYQFCDNGDLRTVNMICDENYSITGSTIDFFRK